MQLHFVPTEPAFAYFEATRAYLEQHGKLVTQLRYREGLSVFIDMGDRLNINRSHVGRHVRRDLQYAQRGSSHDGSVRDISARTAVK
jgi:hypothetical protein